MFVSGTACLMLYNGKCQPGQLPRWLLGGFGRRYAYPLLLVMWFSAVALRIFGFLHLQWYWVPVELVAGLIVSAILQVLLGYIPFVTIGLVLLVTLPTALWIIR